MTTKKKAAPKKKATKKVDVSRGVNLESFDLLGVKVGCKPRIRNSAIPKYSALSKRMGEIFTVSDIGGGVDPGDLERALGMRISSKLWDGLDDETMGLLIEFAVEILTMAIVKGASEDYATLPADRRADFIDLNFSPVQLVSLFFAAWAHYAVGQH